MRPKTEKHYRVFLSPSVSCFTETWVRVIRDSMAELTEPIVTRSSSANRKVETRQHLCGTVLHLLPICFQFIRALFIPLQANV